MRLGHALQYFVVVYHVNIVAVGMGGRRNMTIGCVLRTSGNSIY